MAEPGDLADLAAWAAARGVAAWQPGLSPGLDRDFSRDFGRFLCRVPGLVLRPERADDLAASMAAAFERGLAYKLRGLAHTSGGQVLTDGGVVIDTSGVRGVGADAGGSIEVLAGTTWLELVDRLHPGRRPLVLTDNLRTTIGGTLAVGGIGDTSLHFGLQVSSVLSLDWITPDGSRRRLRPGDELGRFVLAGCGLLGALEKVRLQVVARPPRLTGHVAAWRSLEEFVAAALENRRRRLYEFTRATALWRSDGAVPVRAILANFGDEPPPRDAARLAALAPLTSAPLPASDRIDHARADHSDKWGYVCPALEMFLPLPGGLSTWRGIQRRIHASGLAERLPDGSAVMVVPTDARFPLAPFAGPELNLVVAIRPQLASPAEARVWLPVLEDLAGRALDGGGKLYLISIPIARPDFLARQFGAALAPLLRWKRELDPRGLCNPGLLGPPGAASALGAHPKRPVT